MENEQEPVVLTVDIGGSHVKIKTSVSDEERRVDSGPELTAQQMQDAMKTLTEGWSYDLVSIGYPGPVRNGKPAVDPVNLGQGWVGFDFEAGFGKPVKFVNDALMQAIGSYEGGRMLFLGLGTGLGAAMVVENVAQPLELAHMPYKKGKTFEEYVGEPVLERRGKKKWRKTVADVLERLYAGLQPDYIVIGGGNVSKLETLPEYCRRGSNSRAFEGGFRLWKDKNLIV